jgi:hypothetical protein
MKIIKENHNYIFKGFHELSNHELESEVLSCFLENDSMLLFGCKWRVIQFNNLDNEEMSEQTKKMYKELAQFMVLDEENDNKISRTKSFIDERTVFINNEWPFSWNSPNKEVKETIWFQPRDKMDLIETIKIDEFYNCIVLDKKSEFKDYSYTIEVREDDDGSIMVVSAKDENEFETIVIPRIKRLIGNLIIKVE